MMSRMLVVGAVVGALVPVARADTGQTGPAAPSLRAPDGVPAGYALPSAAQSGRQTFEFGRCGTRQHATGGWVCVEPDPAAAASRKRKTPSHPRARAAASSTYSRYSFHSSELTVFGIGETKVGQIRWTQRMNFNGLQGQVGQTGEVWLYGPPVRYDFRVEMWRQTDDGWEERASYRDIRPHAPNFTELPTNMYPWYYPFKRGHTYFADYYFHLRAEGVNNPSSPDGVFYSPMYASKRHHCVDSRGSCYFIGY